MDNYDIIITILFIILIIFTSMFNYFNKANTKMRIDASSSLFHCQYHFRMYYYYSIIFL